LAEFSLGKGGKKEGKNSHRPVCVVLPFEKEEKGRIFRELLLRKHHAVRKRREREERTLIVTLRGEGKRKLVPI